MDRPTAKRTAAAAGCRMRIGTCGLGLWEALEIRDLIEACAVIEPGRPTEARQGVVYGRNERFINRAAFNRFVFLLVVHSLETERGVHLPQTAGTPLPARERQQPGFVAPGDDDLIVG